MIFFAPKISNGRHMCDFFKQAKNAIKKWCAEVMRVIAAIIGFCDPPKIVIGDAITCPQNITRRFVNALQ